MSQMCAVSIVFGIIFIGMCLTFAAIPQFTMAKITEATTADQVRRYEKTKRIIRAYFYIVALIVGVGIVALLSTDAGRRACFG